MIGINYFKKLVSLRVEDITNLYPLLIKEKWHRVEELLSIEGREYDDMMVASMYDGYPIHTWYDENAVYVIEGIIYNIPETSIHRDLEAIGNCFSKELIGRFVKEADGDFIVSIFKKDTKQVLFFNDELGGLPFHYYYSDDMFISGRNLTFIAALSKSKLSRPNIAELICFDYNMANRTIFENICSFTPAMYILCSEDNGRIAISKGATVNRSYSLIDSFKTKSEAIDALKELFLKGCKSRCDYARSNGYDIVNTLSGGYDSRTVLGGIEKCIPSEDYQNLTYEYKQDESAIASKVLNAINSKSKYIKLSYKNSPQLYESDLSFKTEGKIETYTNSICYNDLAYSYENHFKGKRILFFGGFGGEYIRHPLFATIWNASNIEEKMSPTLKEASRLLDVDYKRVREMLKSTFKDCNSSESFCKMFYDEYYRNYVRGAGEERQRMFYFTVQPMMSKSFILAIRNRIPLKWVGYEFYTDFLKAINPALTSVELYGGVPDIFSIRSLRNSDKKNKSRLYHYFYLIIRRLHYKQKKRGGNMDFEPLSKKIRRIETIFDKEYLEKHFYEYNQHVQCKIAAVLFYVSILLLKRKLWRL